MSDADQFDEVPFEDLSEPTVEDSPPPPDSVDSTPPPSFPWGIGLFLTLAILVVVFAVQNTQSVELHFLGWSWELPLVIVILATVVVSVLLDEILGLIIRRRKRRRYLEREELKRLRAKP